MKVLIIYDTKYGNTKKVAELIGDGLKIVEENVIKIENVKEIDLNKDETYDLILIGSPNHMGSYTTNVKKFIKKLPNSLLKGKSFAVFDTYLGKDFEKVVKKMEKQINKVMPNLNKISPGLSIKVGGMKGPIVDEDLPKCKEFGINLTK
ncbi:MAG: flavodoxin domain-containing protein [Promethearchaeota archaeon]|nr:MAG: flavodoxin domain-containing protein [Candidatus Lokiarchaeota archaeon]